MSAETNLLLDLVSIPSTSYKEDKACAYLNARLPSFGWDRSYIDNVGNVVATKGEGDNEIILLGHIDTVEGRPTAKVEDDILGGRGSVDAKGPLCSMAIAGGKVKLARNCKLSFIAAVGEESTCAAFFIGCLFINLYSHCWRAIEHSGITIGYRGCIRAILVRGRRAHRSANGGPLSMLPLQLRDIKSIALK